MAVKWFGGAETGDLREMALPGNAVIETSITYPGGAYAYRHAQDAAQAARCSVLMAATTFYTRSHNYFHVTTPPSVDSDYGIIWGTNTAETAQPLEVRLRVTTAGVLSLVLWNWTTNLQVGSPFGISADTWYTIETESVISATVGVLELKVNNVVVATGSGLNTGVETIDRLYLPLLFPVTALNSFVGYTIADDIICGTDAYFGEGICVARQGTAGTPTYDSFTKVGAATAALCWSDTPFNASTNCTSIVNGGAQTMLTAPFDVTQSGHGLGTIDPLDVINACKTSLIGKVAVATTHSIRRRLSGVNTDTSKSITTSDKYFDDGVWTDSLADLNSSEIGVLHGANVNLLTIEDVWLIVDYAPVGLPWLFQTPDTPFSKAIIQESPFPIDPYPKPTALVFANLAILPEAFPALNLSKIREHPSLLDPHPKPPVPSLINWSMLPEAYPLAKMPRIQDARIMFNPNPIGPGPGSLDWWVLTETPRWTSWMGRILGQVYFDGLIQIGVPTAQLFNLKTAGVGL